MSGTNTKKLIFIGGQHDNWDLYADSNGKVWAVPKPTACPSTKTCFYGDRNHLLRLMREGHDLGQATEAGLEFMSGLFHQFMPQWNWLKFHNESRPISSTL